MGLGGVLCGSGLLLCWQSVPWRRTAALPAVSMRGVHARSPGRLSCCSSCHVCHYLPFKVSDAGFSFSAQFPFQVKRAGHKNSKLIETKSTKETHHGGSWTAGVRLCGAGSTGRGGMVARAAGRAPLTAPQRLRDAGRTTGLTSRILSRNIPITE